MTFYYQQIRCVCLAVTVNIAVDNDTAGAAFRQKAYLSEDGKLGVAVWNSTDAKGTAEYTNTQTGKTVCVTLEKDEVCFVEL